MGMEVRTVVVLAAMWMAVSAAGQPSTPGPIKVEIRNEGGRFRLYRGGAPYYIKGAVYWTDATGRFPLKDLAARGGNSIRTGIELRRTLDEAQRLGMTVTIGLPMKMESVHKFDYSDEQAVRGQFLEMKKLVLEYKDHPALLMWGIGNELSVGHLENGVWVPYKNKDVWQAVNDVARMIHEVDPNHPAMTVSGEETGEDLVEIGRRCADLDLIGINRYKGLEELPAQVRKAGWEKPYVVTEWGPSGDWQVPRTAWGAAIEETSTEKAQRYQERYQRTMGEDTERCLGSYAFIWQWRHERTQTWYGMFLESGERTEAVNVMQYLWTGHWPANRAPRIQPPRIESRTGADNIHLKPCAAARAEVKADDPDGDRLTFRWEIMLEVARAGYAGRGERRSKPMPELIKRAAGGRLAFVAPGEEGAYRMFVYVFDGNGNGATANVPFYVKR